MDSVQGSRALRDLMQSELRRTLAMPVIRDTGQQVPPDSPVTVARTGAPTWLVQYDAALGHLPSASSPAWTNHSTGSPTETVAAGLLTVTAPTSSDSLYYGYALPALDNAVGALTEWLVRVTASDSGANKGAALGFSDGARQWMAWCREDGLNLDGQPDVPWDLTTEAHWVRIIAKGVGATLYVDGQAVQTGGPANVTTAKSVEWGSWVAPPA